MSEYDLILQIQFASDGRDALGELRTHLDAAPLFDVLAKAGDSTWQGTTPDAFREAVRYQCDVLRGVIDEIGAAGQYLLGRIRQLELQLLELREARAAALAAAAIE